MLLVNPQIQQKLKDLLKKKIDSQDFIIPELSEIDKCDNQDFVSCDEICQILITKGIIEELYNDIDIAHVSLADMIKESKNQGYYVSK